MAELEKLGRYRIEAVLGKGAMGVVYKAYDPELRQSVAIKTIRKEILDQDHAADNILLERFKNEVIAGRRLMKHRNIVGTYEFGQEQEICFIVMEYVEGKPLKDYLDKGHRFTLGEVMNFMRQLLDALQFAHEQGIVHRDIKPANIMLTPHGQIQITDFGIAKIDSASMTKTGTVMGTPSYMSPEQCLGQHVDARTDIFSAGVVLYQLLTGENPFVGTSAMTTMHKVLNITPINPSQFNVHISKIFDRVMQKALAKRPDARFQSAREFAQALQSVVIQEQEKSAETAEDEATVLEVEVPKAPPKPEKKPKPAQEQPAPWRPGKLGILGIALTIALGVIGAVVLVPPEPTKTPSEPELLTSPKPPLDRAKLDALLSSFTCARLQADFDPDRILLSGHLQPEDLPKLKQRLAEIPGLPQVIYEITALTWPYCELVEILFPLKQLNQEQRLGLEITPYQHPSHYVEEENLVLAYTIPSYNSYIYIDYYQLDGGVIHLFPNGMGLNKPVAAKTRHILGDTAKGQKQWQIHPPFGTEMIVIIASSTPLFDQPRPELEQAKDYLSALRKAITVKTGQGQLAADYFSITTKATSASS
ncbi:MAG: serine/threonine-protein kinase [Pseudomonadota bacterium]|nr:serine/threonine-protein kinase [Pseudomonadota bacterium]